MLRQPTYLAGDSYISSSRQMLGWFSCDITSISFRSSSIWNGNAIESEALVGLDSSRSLMGSQLPRAQSVCRVVEGFLSDLDLLIDIFHGGQ